VVEQTRTARCVVEHLLAACGQPPQHRTWQKQIGVVEQVLIDVVV
jgi:hypothetical protein